MNSINKFCVMGRLVKDPEMKELENGNKVANITLAVDRDYKDKEGNKITDFLSYALWNKDAERICDFSQKGAIVCLEGSFNDKEIEIGEGKKIHTFNPVVETYKHITNAKTQESEVEKPSKTKKAKETEVVK